MAAHARPPSLQGPDDFSRSDLIEQAATGAIRAPMPGRRWHFQHGPIDILIAADGDPRAVAAAHDAAWARFETVLSELVAELPALRRAIPAGARTPDCGLAAVGESGGRALAAGPDEDPACPVTGVIARQMWRACRPFRSCFVTPMAAVAGAVAQHLIACYDQPGVRRAYVNNGGDIALHLAPGEHYRVGLYANLRRFDAVAAARADAGVATSTDAEFDITHDLPVRGVATSGWRGRSFSLGIADSVTVLARSAAQADAAATVIANAVDVDDPRIERRAANTLQDDTDLGDIPVTVAVPTLEPEAVRRAIDAGLATAHALRAAGLIEACAIVCQDQVGQVFAREAHAGGATRPSVVGGPAGAGESTESNRGADGTDDISSKEAR